MSIALPAETSAVPWPRRTRTDELRRQLADDIVHCQLALTIPPSVLARANEVIE